MEISASRLVGIVAVGRIRQYIFNELWWRDGLDCLKSKYYLQLHLKLFRHAVRNVLRSYFCHFPRGGNDFRTHTFPTTAGLRSRSALSRVGGTRQDVKCCCSRRRHRRIFLHVGTKYRLAVQSCELKRQRFTCCWILQIILNYSCESIATIPAVLQFSIHTLYGEIVSYSLKKVAKLKKIFWGPAWALFVAQTANCNARPTLAPRYSSSSLLARA